MGATVSSMFGPGAAHAAAPSASAGTPLLALALVFAAVVVAVVLRRRLDPGGGLADWGRRAARDVLGRALAALAGTGTGIGIGTGTGTGTGTGAGAGRGPALRVLSRLPLGPGRYLCMVEAGGRVLLVAVGGEVGLLAEVEAHLPHGRGRRQAPTRRRLAARAASLDGEAGGGAAPAAVVALSPQASAGAAGAAAAGAAAPPTARSPGEPAAATPVAGPDARTAALLDRYRAAAEATTAPAARVDDGSDEEAAAYFCQLLEASIERMEAAEKRILRRPDRPPPRRRPARAEPAADAWRAEDAGL